MHIFCEKTDNCFKHGPNRPRRVPLLRMILCDGEANLGIGLKPSIFIHEDDIWRFEGILIGKQDLAVIYPFMELCTFRALEGEVPGVKIVL